MTAHQTEEEQLEQLKRLWDEYGKSVVVGAIIAVASYLSYEGWTDYQIKQAESASSLFQNIQELSSAENITAEQSATLKHLAGQLKAEYPDSLYANFAAMTLAKLAVEANDLDSAETELRWALAQQKDPAVSAVLNARLARVLAEKGDYVAAHVLVAKAGDSSFTAQYAEIRGDIYFVQQQFSDARNAYQQALDSLLPQEANRRPLLMIKINDLPADEKMTVSSNVGDDLSEGIAEGTAE